MNSIQIINNLSLLRHPEGGWYREVYRSDEHILQHALPERFSGNRCFATSIYFLLESGEFSAFHKIHSDETWHFYKGSPLSIHMLDKSGNYSHITLGDGLHFQYTVPAGYWFAAEVQQDNSFALVGCSVSPGFDFADFELAQKSQLLQAFPKHESLITRLCIR